MNGTVSQQFLLLFLDLGIGAGIGFLFDCYRALRRLLRPGWLVTQAADLFFWICCALLVFQVFFAVTGGCPLAGAIGFYNMLIILGGSLLFLRLISPWLQRPLLLLFRQLARLLAWLCRILRYAAWLLCQAIIMPLRGLWWLAGTSLKVVTILLRLLWLPEKLILRWLWRMLREGWRCLRRWLSGLVGRLLHRFPRK
jgi:spore cortex biosynthesis protein YabQ